jgi:hypothetical protein
VNSDELLNPAENSRFSDLPFDQTSFAGFVDWANKPDKPTHDAGVYFFATRELPDEPSDIIYFGASVELRGRIDSHYGGRARTYAHKGLLKGKGADRKIAKFYVENDRALKIAWCYVKGGWDDDDRPRDWRHRLKKEAEKVQDDLLEAYEDDHGRLPWFNRQGRVLGP